MAKNIVIVSAGPVFGNGELEEATAPDVEDEGEVEGVVDAGVDAAGAGVVEGVVVDGVAAGVLDAGAEAVAGAGAVVLLDASEVAAVLSVSAGLAG